MGAQEELRKRRAARKAELDKKTSERATTQSGTPEDAWMNYVGGSAKQDSPYWTGTPEHPMALLGEGFKNVGRAAGVTGTEVLRRAAEAGPAIEQKGEPAGMGMLSDVQRWEIGKSIRAAETKIGRPLNDTERNNLRLSYRKGESEDFVKNMGVAQDWIKDTLRNNPEVLKDSTFLGDILLMGPQVASQILLTIASGGATAGLAVGGAFMGSQIYGTTFENLTNQGVDPDRAHVAAMANMLVQTPMEQIGVGKLIKYGKGGAIKVLKSMGQEGVTEFLQEYPDAAAEIWGKGEGKQLKGMVDEFVAKLPETTRSGIRAGAVGAVAGGGVASMKRAFGVTEDLTDVGLPEEAQTKVDETVAKEAVEKKAKAEERKAAKKAEKQKAKEKAAVEHEKKKLDAKKDPRDAEIEKLKARLVELEAEKAKPKDVKPEQVVSVSEGEGPGPEGIGTTPSYPERDTRAVEPVETRKQEAVKVPQRGAEILREAGEGEPRPKEPVGGVQKQNKEFTLETDPSGRPIDRGQIERLKERYTGGVAKEFQTKPAAKGVTYKSLRLPVVRDKDGNIYKGRQVPEMKGKDDMLKPGQIELIKNSYDSARKKAGNQEGLEAGWEVDGKFVSAADVMNRQRVDVEAGKERQIEKNVAAMEKSAERTEKRTKVDVEKFRDATTDDRIVAEQVTPALIGNPRVGGFEPSGFMHGIIQSQRAAKGQVNATDVIGAANEIVTKELLKRDSKWLPQSLIKKAADGDQAALKQIKSRLMQSVKQQIKNYVAEQVGERAGMGRREVVQRMAEGEMVSPSNVGAQIEQTGDIADVVAETGVARADQKALAETEALENVNVREKQAEGSEAPKKGTSYTERFAARDTGLQVSAKLSAIGKQLQRALKKGDTAKIKTLRKAQEKLLKDAEKAGIDTDKLPSPVKTIKTAEPKPAKAIKEAAPKKTLTIKQFEGGSVPSQGSIFEQTAKRKEQNLQAKAQKEATAPVVTSPEPVKKSAAPKNSDFTLDDAVRETKKDRLSITDRVTNERGAAPLMNRVAEGLYNMGKKLAKTLSVEMPYREMDAEATGLAAKTLFSRTDRYEKQNEKKLADFLKKIHELFPKGANPKALMHAVFAAESKDAKFLEKIEDPTYKAQIAELGAFLRNYFDEAKAAYKNRNIDVDYKRRRLAQLRQKLEDSSKKDISDTERADLEDAIKQMEEMEYIHIPYEILFNQLRNATDKRKTYKKADSRKKLKLTIEQMRKGGTLYDLYLKGELDEKQINPFEIMGNYGRRQAKDFALADLRDAAIKDGFIVYTKTKPNKPSKSGTGWVKIPKELSALGKYVEKAKKGESIGYMDAKLFDTMQHTLQATLESGQIDRIIGKTKMWQFANFLFLPVYDMYQSVMAGNLTVPLQFKGGLKSVREQDKDYQEAAHWGLFSKPYAAPFAEFQTKINSITGKAMQSADASMIEKAIRWMQDSGSMSAKRANDAIRKMHSGNLSGALDMMDILDPLYALSWNVSWQLDEAVRMSTYKYMRKRGMSAQDAAQTAAKYHADYASIPANSRKMLNRIFFTPTFQLVMGKLYAGMIKSNYDMIVKGDKKNTTKALAKGVFMTMGINIAFDAFMQSLGYERDEFGRRYTKEYKNEKGQKKEHVMVFSNPSNLPFKWSAKTVGAMTKSPETGLLDGMQNVLSGMKWDLHPMWRTAYAIKTNETMGGEEIYNRNDTDFAKVVKSTEFLLNDLLGIWRLGSDAIFGRTVGDSPSVVEAKNKLAQDIGWLGRVLSQFAFQYSRSPKERAIAQKIQNEVNYVKKTVRKEIYRKGVRRNDWIEKAKRRVEKLRKELKDAR